MNKANACGLTPVVSKVSSGAIEFIPLYSVKFVSHFFDDAKKSPLNFKVISTSLDQEASDSPESAAVSDEDNDDQDDVISFGALDGEDFSDSVKVSNPSNLISLDELRLERGARENVILVLGSEGEGVSRTITRCADH